MKQVIYTMLTMAMFVFPLSQSFSCEFALPIQEKLRMSDAVYIGTVKSRECQNNTLKIHYAVSAIWKGDKNPEYTITRNGCSKVDNAKIYVESAYLVFAKKNAGNDYSAQFDFCFGDSIIEIKSNLYEWLDAQWEHSKRGVPISWKFWEKWGSQAYIMDLGDPKYIF